MVPPSSHKVSRVLRYSGSCSLTQIFTYGTLTLFRLPSHAVRLTLVNAKCSPKPQKHCCFWFGLFRVRSPLLAESRLISLPPYSDVSVQAVPLIQLWIHCMIHRRYPMWIAPFGHLRINACLQLPAAFRSLPRPSSAPSAKAFTLSSL